MVHKIFCIYILYNVQNVLISYQYHVNHFSCFSDTSPIVTNCALCRKDITVDTRMWNFSVYSCGVHRPRPLFILKMFSASCGCFLMNTGVGRLPLVVLISTSTPSCKLCRYSAGSVNSSLVMLRSLLKLFRSVYWLVTGPLPRSIHLMTTSFERSTGVGGDADVTIWERNTNTEILELSSLHPHIVVC